MTEKLVAARAEIKRGWARGVTDWNGDGPVCGLGAIWRVTVRAGDREAYWPVVSALALVIPASYGVDWYDRITRFNDDPATTLADVLASIDRAIAVEANPDPAHTYPLAR